MEFLGSLGVISTADTIELMCECDDLPVGDTTTKIIALISWAFAVATYFKYKGMSKRKIVVLRDSGKALEKKEAEIAELKHRIETLEEKNAALQSEVALLSEDLEEANKTIETTKNEYEESSKTWRQVFVQYVMFTSKI